ncbi:hypothetical protein DQ04_09331000 [Trypanosoma grayi]|uniref:hypothetical protein n=1 Tax=Trypanosoma grayi TaxID=71804 RepID=UPI0004F3F7BA|nr:hypothetical protein DQ04_09331000 [Trypanosoma grayi]KEG07591.1 hypothetical protein DQ04_09331000 [Trypanosoma grayi]
METAELVNTLLKAEEDCRVLRDDVATLEKSRRFKLQDVSTITPPPTESGSISKASKGRTLLLPIEAVGDLNNKAGEVTLLVREYKKLLGEQKQLESILEVSLAKTAEANEENKELKKLIGCSNGEPVTHVKDATEAIAYANGLRHDVMKALVERDGVKVTLKRQTECLRKIATELVGTRNLEELREEAAQQLEKKRLELENIRDETDAMRRLLGRKDKMLEKEVPIDEVAVARAAETDRRVVMHRLEKEQKNVRLNEMAVRHRALQIAKLEKRIEMIGDAVGGDESAADERVDAELVEQLRKEILSLGRVYQECGARLELLDADVSDLDRRATGLTRTTANVKKEMRRLEKDHRKFTNFQRKELEVEQAATEQEIRDIEREVEMLRKVTACNGRK